jgi:RNA polymerase sigma-70 factor (ECF subfamily)
MNSTSISLLNRLQQTDDSKNWNRLVELYAPLLRVWLRKYDVQASDADDLVQEVLMAVSTELKSFDHSGRPGAFRSWLRTILAHRLRNFWRAQGRRPQARGDSDIERRLELLEDPASELSEIWNRQHDRHVVRQLLATTESSFEPSTWKAFCRVAIEGARPDLVATELGISLNAVFIAKFRVLKRLREEAEGLIESSSSFFGKC